MALKTCCEVSHHPINIASDLQFGRKKTAHPPTKVLFDFSEFT